MREADNTAIFIYLPVIQGAYLEFFRRHPGVPICIFDQELISEFPGLRKDLRALPPRMNLKFLKLLEQESPVNFPHEVFLLSKTLLD